MISFQETCLRLWKLSLKIPYFTTVNLGFIRFVSYHNILTDFSLPITGFQLSPSLAESFISFLLDLSLSLSLCVISQGYADELICITFGSLFIGQIISSRRRKYSLCHFVVKIYAEKQQRRDELGENKILLSFISVFH